MNANLDVFLQKVHQGPNVDNKNSKGAQPNKRSSSSSEKSKKTTANDKGTSRSGKGIRKDK